MYSSFNIWPTSTNPAIFIPVVVKCFPFENYNYTIVYSEVPESCPNCKRYIDKHISREGENKYKCNWCSKTFKSTNPLNIESQIRESSQMNNAMRFKNLTKEKLLTKYPSNFSQWNEQPLIKSTLLSSIIYREHIGNHTFDKSDLNRSDKKDFDFYCYTLFFVIDTCVSSSDLEILKEYLIIAIESLKPSQSFVLSVLYQDHSSYVFTNRSSEDEECDTFTFNFSYEKKQKVFNLIDLRKPANFTTNLSAIKKFINSIHSDITETKPTLSLAPKPRKNIKETKNPIDFFIQQLIGNDHLFSEIVLFSTNGPSIEVTKQIFVDFISPEKNIKSKPLVDGFFICSDFPNPKEQIKYMIQKIMINPIIFNVEVNAYVTNYRFLQDTNHISHFSQFSPFSSISLMPSSNVQSLSPSSNPSISLVSQCSSSFSTAKENFNVSFQLFSSTKFTNAFNLFAPSYFGVETTFIKFFNNGVYRETVWIARVFKKSSDFIPTITSLNPFLLIPYLCSESAFKVQSAQNQKMSNLKKRSQTHSNFGPMKTQELTQDHSMAESFVLSLLKNYRYLCIVSIPGKFDDFTFSTIPELQWFLRIVFEHLVDYHDIMHICDVKNKNAIINSPHFLIKYESIKNNEANLNNVPEIEEEEEDRSYYDDDDDDDDMDYFDSISINIFENHKKFLLNSMVPISASITDDFARFYPLISFWANENNIMANNCPLDASFYESDGSPPIVIIDTFFVLFVFADNFKKLKIEINDNIDKNAHFEYSSLLSLFINERIQNRFPRTLVSVLPLQKFFKLLPEKNKLFACIKYYVKNNLLHKLD